MYSHYSVGVCCLFELTAISVVKLQKFWICDEVRFQIFFFYATRHKRFACKPTVAPISPEITLFRLLWTLLSQFTHIFLVDFTDVNEPACKWSEWSDWSECPERCDVRQRTRTRNCTSPTPCPGDAMETENCL